MILEGVLLAVLSGVSNGLFTAPMKLEKRWHWENIWFGFILVACLAMPPAVAAFTAPQWLSVIAEAPPAALAAALGFGFAWGFGAISFGRSVDSLGVSIANSLVIGLSSALGSLTPLLLNGEFRLNGKIGTLLAGIAAFLCGVVLCGAAGILRDRRAEGDQARPSPRGYLFAVAAGIMSAIFNIGFTLASPIAAAGIREGLSPFAANNCIWVAMLGAGSIPNIGYCLYLMRRNGTARLLAAPAAARGWPISAVMGLLWGGSIFLYGAAVPQLGAIGPSIGWPLSLAVGLVVANLMGLLLGEWRSASPQAASRMRWGLLTLLGAIVLCAASAGMSE